VLAQWQWLEIHLRSVGRLFAFRWWFRPGYRGRTIWAEFLRDGEASQAFREQLRENLKYEVRFRAEKYGGTYFFAEKRNETKRPILASPYFDQDVTFL
jgi:hypothetical protein